MEIAEAGGQSAEPSISLPRAPSESAVSDPSTQSPKPLANTPPESAPMPQPRPAKQQAEPTRASVETAQPDSAADKETEKPTVAVDAAPTSTDVAIDGRKKKRSEKRGSVRGQALHEQQLRLGWLLSRVTCLPACQTTRAQRQRR